jgi:hypothetical protein
MKHLLVLLFFLGVGCHVSAQDIFNTVLDDAKKVINDTTSNVLVAKIAQFKYTTLQYIKKKSFEGAGDVTKEFLDNQAYYMTEFLSTFFKSALLNTQLTKSEKKNRIMSFIDASGSNPLFNETETDIVNAYVENGEGQLTPFSINTDWPKAYAAIRSILDKEKK